MKKITLEQVLHFLLSLKNIGPPTEVENSSSISSGTEIKLKILK